MGRFFCVLVVLAAAVWYGVAGDEQRLTPAQLDPESRACMGCHNGSGGRAIALRPVTAPVEMAWEGHLTTVNHSIGMDYAQSYLENRALYTPPAALNPAITLVNGRVGCLSCHLKKREEAGGGEVRVLPASLARAGECTADEALARKVFGSSLCVECHDAY